MLLWTLVGCFAMFIACCHTAVSTGSYRREMEQDSVLDARAVGAAGSKEKRSAGANKECDPKWSTVDPKHTMCLVDVGEEVVLDQVTKDALLQKHNELRGKVVPAAADMPKLVWDDDLALVAAKWARQCVMGHDEFTARRVPSLPGVFVGQNGAYGHSAFLSAIQSWFDEFKGFKYGLGAIGYDAVGHYTQLVAARTQRVGCGQALCKGTPYKNHYFCNYALGQFASDLRRPYKASSTSCSACPDRCDSSGKLCECKGKICLNKGTFNIATCSCMCKQPYSGDECRTVDCPVADSSMCNTSWPPSYCTRSSNVPRRCPYMCGLCRRSG